MSLPSETDLPDPPLDIAGELQLPLELEAVADRLRREAVIVAEAAVPQIAAAPLLRHAAAGGQRQTWRQVALAVALLSVCASFAAIALILRHAAELARPLPNGSRPMISQRDRLSIDRGAEPEVDSMVFLSSDGGPTNSELELDLAAAADSLTAEQRIELLERTLDRYRDALSAYQEELKRVNEELAKKRE